MSRRARNRPDKRELARTVHSVDTDDLDMLMAAAWDEHAPEHGAVQLKDGTAVNTKDWWRLPGVDAGEAA